MDINWYPGHMAKAKRQLAQQLGRVDLVIELCDARLPHASRNPDLDRLIGGKTRVLLLNKADLADPNGTQAWLRFFRQQGLDAMAYVSTAGKVKEALEMIERAARETVERAAEKGVRKTVRAMVVGVPNVGKSTFINRLHGGSIAKVGDRPGVTRGKQWITVDQGLELLDTPGILWPKFEDETIGLHLAFTGAVRDAIMDVETLACHLIQLLAQRKPESLAARFKLVPEEGMDGWALLEAGARKRGFLISGGEVDLERMAHILLDEFRGGKMGRITLELPEDLERGADPSGAP